MFPSSTIKLYFNREDTGDKNKNGDLKSLYNHGHLLYLYYGSQRINDRFFKWTAITHVAFIKKPLPEAVFIHIRQLVVKLLAKQLDEITEEWENENGITEKHYEELSKQHFRSSYKKL